MKGLGRLLVAVAVAATSAALPTVAFAETARPEAKRLNAEGMKLYREGRFAEARQRFEKAVRSDPDHLMFSFNLACMLVKTGEPDRAHLLLHRLVLRDAKRFVPRLRADPDLEPLRRSGHIEKIIAAGGLPPRAEKAVTAVLAAPRAKHGRTEVAWADVDDDGTFEAFAWVSHSRIDGRTHDLVAVQRRAKGLSVTRVAELPLLMDWGTLDAYQGGIALLSSPFSGSHQTEVRLMAVRVAGPRIEKVWERHAGLESTCLGDECAVDDYYNGRLQLTLVDLDADTEPELVINEVDDCDYRRLRQKVLDLQGSRLAPMKGGRTAIRRRAKALRAKALSGDVTAAEALLRLQPRDQKVRLALIRAALPAKSSMDCPDEHIEIYALLATKVALRKLPDDRCVRSYFPPSDPYHCRHSWDAVSLDP